MTQHPYKFQPPRSFWSQAVENNYQPIELLNFEKPILRIGDKITSAGSCFASNLIPYIESAGFQYLRTEKLPKIFSDMGQNLGYANFSAAYGNIYTARQLNQLYMRALGTFKPIEDRWVYKDEIIDPFRPGLKFNASSEAEFDLITASHLSATREAFESASLFVFTLGLTEAWFSRVDGSVFPACPGTISGEFNEKNHGFHNFSVDEIIDDLSNFIVNLRNRNKNVRFLLSVSPVPLVATASRNHVLTASIYSKSVLRVAAEEICKNFPNVIYFPAYEIITGPQAPNNFFEKDMRNVSQVGIECVMETLINSKEDKRKTIQFFKNRSQSTIDDFDTQSISKKISEVECDEVMMDDNF